MNWVQLSFKVLHFPVVEGNMSFSIDLEVRTDRILINSFGVIAF